MPLTSTSACGTELNAFKVMPLRNADARAHHATSATSPEQVSLQKASGQRRQRADRQVGFAELEEDVMVVDGDGSARSVTPGATTASRSTSFGRKYTGPSP